MSYRYPPATYQSLISTYWNNTADLRYVPWGADLEHPTITSEHVAYGPMPTRGQIVGVRFKCAGSAGNTILGFHKNDNVTAVVTDTVSVTADTDTVFDWGSSATFEEGDWIHVSVDPTNAPNQAWVSLKVRFEWE